MFDCANVKCTTRVTLFLVVLALKMELLIRKFSWFTLIKNIGTPFNRKKKYHQSKKKELYSIDKNRDSFLSKTPGFES